jgi:hypothetical protein
MTAIEKMFEMICYLGNGAEGDFRFKQDGPSFKPKQVQAFVAKKVHEFLLSGHSVINTNGERRAIQAFTGSTDLTKIETNVWNAFQETPNFDMLWQAAFRGVPLRKGQLEWSIGNVISGVILKILEEGEKVDYAGITGTAIKGSVDLYGSGLSISWKTREGRDLAGFYNNMIDFRNKRMKEYADAHYGLLAAAAATNQVAYQLTATDTTLDRDIATLTAGYNTIGSATKDKGFGDTANVEMLVYASPLLKQRLNQALRVTSTDMARAGGNGQTVDSNITPLYTYTSAIPANKALMVLPKNKIQNSVYMDEKSFSREDPDNLNFLKSSFTAFGAIVGENDQTAELAFA